MERKAAHEAALRFSVPTRSRLMRGIGSTVVTIEAMMPYRNLKAWQTCHQLALATYRFLDISLGSLSEISYAILFARELGYLSEADGDELDNLRDDAGKITWGLYRLICSKEKN